MTATNRRYTLGDITQMLWVVGAADSGRSGEQSWFADILLLRQILHYKSTAWDTVTPLTRIPWFITKALTSEVHALLPEYLRDCHAVV